MQKSNIHYLLTTSLVGLLAATGASQLQAKGKDMGVINFPISCSAEAQSKFEHGLGLLHHMMYKQAETAFSALTDSDPECAMPHWGIAMTLYHPLWGGEPSKQELVRASESIAKAKSLISSDRELAYISAAEAYYNDWETKSHKERLAVWAKAQQNVLQVNPDDEDALAFAALSELAVANKSDKSYAAQKKVGKQLEKLHSHSPEHPAGFHYLMHAYDNPELANKAKEIASGYGKLAPNVPHALHMPSHIFVRLGQWTDTISWNNRAAKAAIEQSGSEKISQQMAHATDYIVYAHLQRGEDDMAQQALDNALAIDQQQDSFAAAYGMVAAQARYALEREQWAEAARLPERFPDIFTWNKRPSVVAINQFARGLGSARSGDIPGASLALTNLNELHQRLVDDKNDYWATLVDSQRMSVAAWLSFAEGNQQAALQQMRKAAQMEDSVDKHPVTPGAVLPARELLGDMLVLMNKPQKAISAYEAALKISPNRFRSQYGAWQAARMASMKQQENQFQSDLLALVDTSKSGRPAIEEFQSSLK